MTAAPHRLSFQVRGMDCAGCALKIERALERLAGTSDISVNVMTGSLAVTVAAPADAEAVAKAVSDLGYGVSRKTGPATPQDHDTLCQGHNHAHDQHDHAHDKLAPARAGPHTAGDGHDHFAEAASGNPWWNGKTQLALAVATLGAIGWITVHQGWLGERLAFAPAVLIGFAYFARQAYRAARGGTPFSIETLMSVAILGATIIGATGEALVVMILFLFGETLEGVAASRARKGIAALGALVPKTARLLDNGETREVPAESLKIGQTILVRPGDRIAADGEIVAGTSAIDESPVTGESVPVAKGPGASVAAGAINTEAQLTIRVTREAADNTIARIIRLVEEAQGSKSPTQRFIDRFSSVYTPWVLVAAAIVMVAPPLLLGADWQTWIYRSLGLLLVACPCALVLSTPAAIASGLAAGTRRGLLVKGGAALEAIGKVRTIAFDKTGTLTVGRPAVTDILSLAGREDDLLAKAAAIESGSTHPLARAIVAAAEARKLAPPAAADIGAIAGKAMRGRIGGREIAIGSPRYAAESGWPLPAGRIEALEREGKTVVVLAEDDRPLGLIAMRDEPRPDAKAGIAALKALGLDTIMLTGDNARAGQAVAAMLGMTAKAELLPADKLKEIDALKRAGGIAMVGDGINDAPALAAADVGIAMGGGTDVALETGDAALLHEKVGGIADLVSLSRATLANIRQNVALSIGLKLAFLATTLAGVTGLWFAILADTGATVLVTLNALRLLRLFRAPEAEAGP